jgi:mono/diheme cytochrome c family protein
MLNLRASATALILVGVLFGCDDKKAEPASGQAPAAASAASAKEEAAPAAENPALAAARAKKQADTYFSTKCQVCHGPSGTGDGPGAAALKVKPRNYTDPEWQSKITDDKIAKAILEGGAAVGLDPGMPANPDLKDKPELLDALVQKVRSFAKQ